MPDTIDNKELMEVFYEEAQALIAEMRTDLALLSEKDIPAKLDRLFRCSHTLKSSSAAVGFENLREFFQALETIFKLAKDNKFKINSDVTSLLSESVEVCQGLLHKGESADYKELSGHVEYYSSFVLNMWTNQL